LYLLNYFEVSAFPKLTIADSYAIPERNCVKPGQGYNPADRLTHLKVCWNDGAAGQTTIGSEVTGNNENTNSENQNSGVDGGNSHEAFTNVSENTVDQTATNTDTQEGLSDSAQFILPSKPKKIFTLEKTADLHTGDELIMDGLNFYPGSHRTLPEAKTILKDLLELMRSNPTVMIEIQGHVCCANKPNEDGLDDETGDFRLSWNRAQFVRDYLVQNGIAAQRITYRGYAMTHPLVYPETTIQDQIQNRRVEILITAE
jgi:outer membrane protein OmpA-like peptidoglycan-associated protein